MIGNYVTLTQVYYNIQYIYIYIYIILAEKLKPRIIFEFVLIATCCQSVSVTASGPAKSKQSTIMGKFFFYKMGKNGRPIFKNSKKLYLYLYLDIYANATDASHYSWMVR